MTDPNAQKPRVVALAERIQADICKRQLSPGDRYLTTGDAARFFGVGTHSANRALQLLVKWNVLERRQRLGTLVAEPRSPSANSPIRCVHLLVHRNFLKNEGLLADGVVLGIQHVLPQAEMKFSFMPTDESGQYVQRLVGETMRHRDLEGFMLVRAPLDVQRVIAECGLPAVVYGSLFASIAGLPKLDRDHYKAGELLATHMLQSGHGRLIIVMRERLFPGDHSFLDGALAAGAAAGLSAGHITMRSLPHDHAAIRAKLIESLADTDSLPGVICRSEPLAEGAAAAFEAAGLVAEPHIAVADVYRRGQENRPRFAHLRSTLSPEEVGRHIGEMLVTRASGRMPQSETIPVILEPPMDLATANRVNGRSTLTE